MSTNIWIEITKSDHSHGGPGWEFGSCLWSPAQAVNGADRYGIMREPQKGDMVIHFYNNLWPDHIAENRIAGQSIVKIPYKVINVQPPMPGNWANMLPYYRVELEGYTPYSKQLSLNTFMLSYSNLIRNEIFETRPHFYPFNTYGDFIRTVQGMYLARCTPQLHLLIKTALNIEETSDIIDNKYENPHEQYSEGLRKSKETYFWARNPKLSAAATAHYGLTCQACGFNFEKAYGALGEGYIECHHLNPLSECSDKLWDSTIRTDISQVRVLCANCHRVIHHRRPAYKFELLVSMINHQKPLNTQH